jgi:hypothetical protein
MATTFAFTNTPRQIARVDVIPDIRYPLFAEARKAKNPRAIKEHGPFAFALAIRFANFRQQHGERIRTWVPNANTIGATTQYRYSGRFTKEPFMAKKGMISAAIETIQSWIGVGPFKKTAKPGTKQKTKIGPSRFVKKGGKVVKVRR